MLHLVKDKSSFINRMSCSIEDLKKAANNSISKETIRINLQLLKEANLIELSMKRGSKVIFKIIEKSEDSSNIHFSHKLIDYLFNLDLTHCARFIFLTFTDMIYGFQKQIERVSFTRFIAFTGKRAMSTSTFYRNRDMLIGAKLITLSKDVNYNNFYKISLSHFFEQTQKVYSSNQEIEFNKPRNRIQVYNPFEYNKKNIESIESIISERRIKLLTAKKIDNASLSNPLRKTQVIKLRTNLIIKLKKIDELKNEPIENTGKLLDKIIENINDYGRLYKSEACKMPPLLYLNQEHEKFGVVLFHALERVLLREDRTAHIDSVSLSAFNEYKLHRTSPTSTPCVAQVFQSKKTSTLSEIIPIEDIPESECQYNHSILNLMKAEKPEFLKEWIRSS